MLPFMSRAGEMQAEEHLQKESRELLALNPLLESHGLQLSEQQARELALWRREALESRGRVEFGPGIMEKLVYTFCDSPYMGAQNLAENLSGLLDLFYYIKNETCDQMMDGELLAAMEDAFNGECQGAVELMQGRWAEELIGRARGLWEEEEEGEPEEEDDHEE